jgi:hypothetical protein
VIAKRKGAHPMNRFLLTALVLAAALVAGCGDAPKPAAKAKRADSPHAKAQTNIESGVLSSGKVIIVRLQSEGKRVEITSILPSEIAMVKVKGEVAKTIFAVNETGDGIILFSRDLAKDTSYRTELKFTDLESKRGFVFPVVQSDGTLKEHSYALEQIVIPK